MQFCKSSWVRVLFRRTDQKYSDCCCQVPSNRNRLVTASAVPIHPVHHLTPDIYLFPKFKVIVLINLGHQGGHNTKDTKEDDSVGRQLLRTLQSRGTGTEPKNQERGEQQWTSFEQMQDSCIYYKDKLRPISLAQQYCLEVFYSYSLYCFFINPTTQS